jgi:hypothetical protein
MPKITSFEQGYSSSGIIPYVSALLDCGHVSSVVLKPYRGVCCQCHREQELARAGRATICACGRSMFTIIYTPEPHNPADRITAIGDTIECERCASIARDIVWLESLDTETVQHARFKMWCGVAQYHFYKRDSKSPSGVMLIGSVEQTPAIDKLLAAKRISPLSPTEQY